MNEQPGFDAGGPSMASQVPVHIPTDPNGVLRETDGAVSLLANSALVVVRYVSAEVSSYLPGRLTYTYLKGSWKCSTSSWALNKPINTLF